MEICVDDVDGAVVAERAGAQRVELCADLAQGGTTPSIGLLRTVLRETATIGVQVMVRPRGGDFVYSAAEIAAMCTDLAAIGRVAADAPGRVGVVLGVLKADRTIDAEALQRLQYAAAGLPVTFHKAFDETPDLVVSYGILAGLGVERILSSGGRVSAEEGVVALAELVRLSMSPAEAGPRMLVGGGVRPHNVQRVLAATGASEVHLRAQSPSPRQDGSLQTDAAIVRRVVAAVRDASALEHPGTGDVVLALDIGGTNLKGAVVDSRGRVVLAQTIDVGRSGDESLERVRRLLVALHSTATDSGWDVIGAGVVSPGIIDPEDGVVRYASTLGWSDVPLGAVLSNDLGVPVAIGHDVRSAGLAENLFGASAGTANSMIVAIGTGVAASFLSSGVQVVGHLTSAGELGHIPALPFGEPCTCGQRGCLEVYMSGAGLARRYRAEGGEAELTAEGIVAHRDDDEVAQRVWNDGIEALTLGLTTATLLFDPAVIVLTGGVSRAGDALLGPVRSQLGRSLTWREAPPVETSVLSTSGSRIGASVMAFRAAGRGAAAEGWMLADLLAEPESITAAPAPVSAETRS